MTWIKGQSGNVKGRPKGSRNRFTELRDEFMPAYDEIGGRKALVNWAKDNPDMFYKLVVQMLPKERTVDMRTHMTTLEECLLGLNHNNNTLKTFGKAVPEGTPNVTLLKPTRLWVKLT